MCKQPVVLDSTVRRFDIASDFEGTRLSPRLHSKPILSATRLKVVDTLLAPLPRVKQPTGG